MLGFAFQERIFLVSNAAFSKAKEVRDFSKIVYITLSSA